MKGWQLNPHNLCHVCSVFLTGESAITDDDMIKKYGLYLCRGCTQIRSQLPVIQIWEHLLSNPDESKVRRLSQCTCHSQLCAGWVCKCHMDQQAMSIENHGEAKVMAFRSFFGGNVCASCRMKKPYTPEEGSTVMWNCASCDDLVIEKAEANVLVTDINKPDNMEE